ncbi:hypothetical protein LDENG_00150680 [Lucifuga dentata]|nr:hypothetical protein LDENG_00150680 [Lucifuga dentata]
MYSWTFLCVYVTGASLILLLTASQAQYSDYYGDSTGASDYNTDDNATIEYSFYSNTSNDDLEEFLKGGGFIDPDGEDEEEEVTVTTATHPQTTTRGGVKTQSSASLPASVELRTLAWTLLLLISLNIQQLQHTL